MNTVLFETTARSYGGKRGGGVSRSVSSSDSLPRPSISFIRLRQCLKIHFFVIEDKLHPHEVFWVHLAHALALRLFDLRQAPAEQDLFIAEIPP